MLKYQEIKNLVDDEKNLPLLDKIAARFGIFDFKKFVNRVGGFTLAEMLVVMLIGSIFMAASMPIITKRTKTLSDPEIDDIWQYATNKLDIYFEDKVNIGSSDIHGAQLYVSSAGTKANPQIGLGAGSEEAFLRYGASNKFVLGSADAEAGDNANGSIVIGKDAQTYTANSVAIGHSAVVNDDSLAASKSADKVTWNVISFEYFDTTTCLHNLIVSYTQHTHHYYKIHYDYHDQYYTLIGCNYVYGYPEGYEECSFTHHAAYTSHYYSIVYYFTYTPNYSYRFNPIRAAGAYFHHNVKVRCPKEIEVKSAVSGLSEIVYADAPTVGTFSTFLINTASGEQSGWTTIYSKALYNTELAYGKIDFTKTFTDGACYAELYNTSSYTFKKIAAAKARVEAETSKLFTARPSIAIGNGAKATNTNSIAIGYGSHASENSQIVLGSSGSTLYVNGSAVTSDLGLKNVKGLYRRGIKELRKLKTYLFSFKSDEDNVLRAGLIAQDVQKVMPEAVTVSDKKGHLAIKNEYITFAMFNAILDLDESINAISKRQFVLERKVSKQEIRIKKLEKLVNDLKKKN